VKIVVETFVTWKLGCKNLYAAQNMFKIFLKIGLLSDCSY